MDNFKVIYRVLKHLEAALDYEITDLDAMTPERLGVSKERWEQLLIMMVDEGYINGIVCTKSLTDDKRHICEPIEPVITLKGIEYLTENTLVKKAGNMLKGIKDTIPGM